MQLLQQGEIRGASDSQVLMRILDVSFFRCRDLRVAAANPGLAPQHPISHYLPNNTVKLGEHQSTPVKHQAEAHIAG